MSEHRRKSIQKSAKAIFKKTEDREKAGGDYFETGWQATLELMLFMNDINRDMDLGEPVVTEDGILRDDIDQCQTLLNRITVEIDMKLDMFSYLKGVKVPSRNIRNSDYIRVFDATAK